ncbi:serine/threonine protein kinase [Myxococcota bacterium]|nr:serine/threonine protein kinase [Myxococcota bacterium]
MSKQNETTPCPICEHLNASNAVFCQNCGSSLQAHDPEDPLVGRMVGNYRLLQRKGEGGFGVVYRAEHRELHTSFAVKILHPQFSANRQAAERFRREALAAGKLRHEHVVYIADFGQAKGIGYYYAMEFLQGETLKEAIEKAQVFPKERILHIARQVTSAMDRVHALKIVHRDLKPENIFLIEKDGSPDYVKLVDFGIAKIMDEATASITRTGLSVGTPLYMSPEQARGNLRTLDQRSDIYSWAIIVYEMLTGRPPFYSDNPHDVVMQHIRSAVPAMSERSKLRCFSDELEDLFQRALAKDPEQRPPSMIAFYQELEPCLLDPDAIEEKKRTRGPLLSLARKRKKLAQTTKEENAEHTPPSNPSAREIFGGAAAVTSTGEQLTANEANKPNKSNDWRSVFQTHDPSVQREAALVSAPHAQDAAQPRSRLALPPHASEPVALQYLNASVEDTILSLAPQLEPHETSRPEEDSHPEEDSSPSMRIADEITLTKPRPAPPQRADFDEDDDIARYGGMTAVQRMWWILGGVGLIFLFILIFIPSPPPPTPSPKLPQPHTQTSNPPAPIVTVQPLPSAQPRTSPRPQPTHTPPTTPDARVVGPSIPSNVLVIHAQPRAKCFVNGQPIGKTPCQILRTQKSVLLELKQTGFRTHSEQIEPAKIKQERLEIRLKRSKPKPRTPTETPVPTPPRKTGDIFENADNPFGIQHDNPFKKPKK